MGELQTASNGVVCGHCQQVRHIGLASELEAPLSVMLKHFSRFRPLFTDLAAVGVVVSGVVAASVASPGRVLELPGATELTVATVDPTRALDTRYDIGLTSKVVAGEPRVLQVTGTINTWIEADQQPTPRLVVPVEEQLETKIGNRDRM